jgi:hypothetical protein
MEQQFTENSNKSGRIKFGAFIRQLQKDGNYPNALLDKLEAHIIEGKPESVVDSIFHEEPIRSIEVMMRIMLEFAYSYKENLK